jgi:hypothetical protein
MNVFLAIILGATFCFVEGLTGVSDADSLCMQSNQRNVHEAYLTRGKAFQHFIEFRMMHAVPSQFSQEVA